MALIGGFYYSEIKSLILLSESNLNSTDSCHRLSEILKIRSLTFHVRYILITSTSCDIMSITYPSTEIRDVDEGSYKAQAHSRE